MIQAKQTVTPAVYVKGSGLDAACVTGCNKIMGCNEPVDFLDSFLAPLL